MENNKIYFYVAPDEFAINCYRICESEDVKKVIGQMDLLIFVKREFWD